VSISRIFAYLLLSGVLSGCASTKLYPVCFYLGQAAEHDKLSDLSADLRNAFVAVSEANPATVYVTSDLRWIIAKTTPNADTVLAKTWPRVGCRGPAFSSSQAQAEAECVAYIQDFISSGRYLVLGKYKGQWWNESPDESRLVYCSKKDAPAADGPCLTELREQGTNNLCK
jgi:hypothetical protein